MATRGWWAAAALALGGLQAWDSHALTTDHVTAGLTLAGLLLPVVGIGLGVSYRVGVAALVIGALLLTAARMGAAGTLNGLHLALFPAAVYILFAKELKTSGTRS